MAIEFCDMSTGEWIPIDTNNSDAVDGKHASGTLNTNAKDNLVDAINELKDNGIEDICMMLSMGGMI